VRGSRIPADKTPGLDHDPATMTLVGVTGGIGMGKSTTAECLRGAGVPLVDADDLARETVEPGQVALAEIQRTFGGGVIGPDGRLHRGKLADQVFGDPTKRKQLEGILHPRIRERWLAAVAAWRSQGQAFGVVVVPLLFEVGLQDDFGVVVCVACSGGTQQRRLACRGWSPTQAAQRIQAQWPIERKMEASRHVIWTEGSLEIHAEQVRRILRRLGAVGLS
jgi:dephospho-CoA kinase